MEKLEGMLIQGKTLLSTYFQASLGQVNTSSQIKEKQTDKIMQADLNTEV